MRKRIKYSVWFIYFYSQATELFIMYLTKLSQRHGSDQVWNFIPVHYMVHRYRTTFSVFFWQILHPFFACKLLLWGICTILPVPEIYKVALDPDLDSYYLIKTRRYFSTMFTVSNKKLKLDDLILLTTFVSVFNWPPGPGPRSGSVIRLHGSADTNP